VEKTDFVVETVAVRFNEVVSGSIRITTLRGVEIYEDMGKGISSHLKI